MTMLPLVLLSTILALAGHVDAIPTNVDVQRDTPPAGVTEFLTVTQKTRITRRRRAAVDHVEFPPTMEFNLKFDNREIDVVLKRNVYMTSDVTLTSNGKRIDHDRSRKTGLYQDRDTKSAFVVKCEDFTQHCTLRGSITVDGRKWDITPEGQTEKLHRAVKADENVKLSFVPNAPSIPGEELHSDAQKKQDQASRRQKRSIDYADYTECLVVENLAILDESIWELYVFLADGVEEFAEALIYEYYISIYLQADLHYDFASFRRNGSCIRLYLYSIEIQKLRNESWSGDNEIDVAGARIAYVKGRDGLESCGVDAAAIDDAAYDLVQCFTRKDITYDDTDNGINDPKRAPRSLGFRETACNTSRRQYASQIVESIGDMVDLLLAHEVSLGLGALEDSDTNDCFEEDGYIMAAEQVINDDDLKLVNVWYFSPCTLDQIFDYLHDYNQSECLLANNFTAAEFSRYDNLPPVGFIIGATFQCEEDFGEGSVPCDPEGLNREFLPDMCSRGMFCTEVEFGNGGCTGQTRPFDGTKCAESGRCSKSVCVIEKALNETCEPGQCSDENSVCNPLTSTCTCIESYGDLGFGCERVCPALFVKFNNSCYLFATTELVFSAAQTYCDQFDTLYYESNLVEWESVEELNFLKTTSNDTVPQPTNGFWNDLFQTSTNGNETFFTSGVKPAAELLDWRSGEPDNRNGQLQLCTMFFKQFNYELADVECLDPRDGTSGEDRRTAFPICKIPL